MYILITFLINSNKSSFISLNTWSLYYFENVTPRVCFWHNSDYLQQQDDGCGINENKLR